MKSDCWPIGVVIYAAQSVALSFSGTAVEEKNLTDSGMWRKGISDRGEGFKRERDNEGKMMKMFQIMEVSVAPVAEDGCTGPVNFKITIWCFVLFQVKNQLS